MTFSVQSPEALLPQVLSAGLTVVGEAGFPRQASWPVRQDSVAPLDSGKIEAQGLKQVAVVMGWFAEETQDGADSRPWASVFGKCGCPQSPPACGKLSSKSHGEPGLRSALPTQPPSGRLGD